MISQKLYLPTSSLNFSNIMSSESISPFSFYAYRKFGYDRFVKVEANDLDNSILLYKKYPIFSVDDSKFENYPIVFEIDIQTIDVEQLESQDIYLTHQTIYLNPFDTRIIFRNAQERQSVLSKASLMIDTKLIPLYQGQFVVLSDEIETFDWQPINISDLPNYDNYAVSYDIAINKLKGMLYGYLLGANESSSKEIVALKRMLKELRNVLSAVLTSPDGQATHYQQQQLDDLYAKINNVLYTLSGFEQRINEVIAEKKESYQSPNFVEILEGEGLYQVWREKQVSQFKLRCHQIMPFSLSYQSTDKVSELDRYIDNIERIIQMYDNKSKLEISKFPVIQNRRIVEVPEQKEFLSTLFNGYMNEVWNGAEFLSSRYEFAKVGGKLFKESSGDKWDNSPARTYINSLLKNLNEYTEFEINSTESDILKSFAAFCQKGEGDIDKLKDYLISNGINDFRIAFALWGLIFGFAEMPKTLTNNLFESQDIQYVSDCYKCIYEQLHSVELEGYLDRTLKTQEKTMGVWDRMKKKGKEVIESFAGKTIEEPQNADNSFAQSESEHKITPIPEELKLMFDSEAFKKLSLPAQEHFKTESLSLYKEKIDKTYIEALKKLEYPKSKTNWQNAIKVLERRQKKIETPKDMNTLSLFPSTGEFLKDLDFLTNDVEFRKLVSAIKGWEKDLKWFIDAHNPKHEDYKYYEGKPIDNESVIKQFIFLKKEKYKKTEDFLRKTYLK